MLLKVEIKINMKNKNKKNKGNTPGTTLCFLKDLKTKSYNFIVGEKLT